MVFIKYFVVLIAILLLFFTEIEASNYKKNRQEKVTRNSNGRANIGRVKTGTNNTKPLAQIVPLRNVTLSTKQITKTAKHVTTSTAKQPHVGRIA